jgi:hypothetical protein
MSIDLSAEEVERMQAQGWLIDDNLLAILEHDPDRGG